MARARAAAGPDWPVDRLRTPYALRHTHASLALNAGVPIPEMAARLGHAPAMLLSIYADIVATDAARWTGSRCRPRLTQPWSLASLVGLAGLFRPCDYTDNRLHCNLTEG